MRALFNVPANARFNLSAWEHISATTHTATATFYIDTRPKNSVTDVTRTLLERASISVLIEETSPAFALTTADAVPLLLQEAVTRADALTRSINNVLSEKV